ncbi:Predicted ATPase [Sanguibacter gelidistatuariae]|uniref:Predicted ATPase n=1 Tax=Sanguibacter gelidistatuariae TaxID=1814289 RepID=A0A1G6TSV4_9MICO|nr:BTAD domain-containing putative transcriptional regulator [Sanguibacter gelidistatuariae]SDD32193.1 Predicted ATPase [Sanguibacter gelidistatuariae]
MPSSNPPPARAAVLGPITLLDPEPVPLTGALVRALLVALALERGHAATIAALTADLWPELPPHAPRSALQTLVSRTRALTAGSLIASTPTGYRLTGPSDLDEAHDLAVAARAALDAGRADAGADLALQGLALWRGDPGEDLAQHPELALQLRTASRGLLDSLDRVLLEADWARGNLSAALPRAERQAVNNPTDELAHLILMRCYADAGRVNDALRVFAVLRDAVADELGTSPGAALINLNSSLLQDPQTDLNAPPAPPTTAATGPQTPAARHIGLRTPPNALLGRDHDVAHLVEALGRERLVTILGPGGLGKTRLAQAVAQHESLDAQAVVVVELAGIRADEDVLGAVASTLGVREETGGQRLGDHLLRADAATRVLERLSETRTLLVLDNCEHVVDGAARWASELLAGVPSLAILATSRSPLAVSGENLHSLAPLAALASGGPGPAVQLFLERARGVRPDAHLPLRAVAQLCERLDGLPLAIELAAARVRTMSVEEISRRLTARFALLTAGDRSAPVRHRTLEAVIDWSWQLLTRQDQDVLARLSIFPDGLDAAGAQVVGTLGRLAVADDSVEIVDALDGLVNQSLLTVAEAPGAVSVRFRMLETVREFAALRLAEAGENDQARDALFAWAVGFTRLHAGHLTGPGQVQAMAATQVEQDTLVHVLRRGIAERRGDVILPVFSLLAMHWTLRGMHSEIPALAPEVTSALVGWSVSPADADAAAMAYLLMVATAFGSSTMQARRALGRLRRLVRTPGLLSGAVRELAELVLGSTDLTATATALVTSHRSVHPFVAMVGNIASAQLAENAGEYDQAREFAERAHQVALGADDVWGAATSATVLAQLASEEGDPHQALHWIELTRDGLARLGADADLSQLRWLEASSLASTGQLDAAERMFTALCTSENGPAVINGAELVDMASVGYAGRAEVAYLRGHLDEAMSLYVAAQTALGAKTQRLSPLSTMFLAGSVSIALLSGDPRAESFAVELRTRVLAARRVTAPFIDVPVLGTAVVALGAYLVHSPSWDRVDDGLFLLALAKRMGSRQDLPSLQWAVHDADARRLHGTYRVETANAAATELAMADVVGQVFTVLRRKPFRV